MTIKYYLNNYKGKIVKKFFIMSGKRYDLESSYSIIKNALFNVKAEMLYDEKLTEKVYFIIVAFKNEAARIAFSSILATDVTTQETELVKILVIESDNKEDFEHEYNETKQKIKDLKIKILKQKDNMFILFFTDQQKLKAFEKAVNVVGT